MTIKQFKPMLAVNAIIENIKYPVWATPKLDGIRCIVINGRCITRTLKDIPNVYIRTKILETLGNIPGVFDGEIIVGSTFNETSSAVMSFEGSPEFKYYVFDYVVNENAYSVSYKERMRNLRMLYGEVKHSDSRWITIINPWFPVLIQNEVELLTYDSICIKYGYEGIMIRSPDGPYKFGRSTVREGYLLKVKQFEDSEAEIIGFEELLHNNNELGVDNLGHAERSTCKDNMIPMNTLGSLKVKDLKTGVEFSLGSGFDAQDRKHIWDMQEAYLHRIVTYKFQPSGQKDLPRFPVFKGFRDPIDMSD